MRTLILIALVVGALVLGAGPAAADDVPLLDGHVLEGRVLEVTEDGLKLEVTPQGGGSAQMTLTADRIEPHWWYARRAAALGTDTEGRLKLAVWAAEHGLFQQAMAQFHAVQKLAPQEAADFKKDVYPKIREGIASGLVASARRESEAGNLKAASRMLHAALDRFGDTHAAADARRLLPSVHERRSRKLRELAHWKKFAADETARETSDQRRQVTDPIVALIQHAADILARMPQAAAQADAVESTRQAGIAYQEALQKIDQALKDHAGDAVLVDRLQALREEAMDGLVQTHVSAGDVYTATGNYEGAVGEADALQRLDPAEAHTLRGRVADAKALDEVRAYGR